MILNVQQIEAVKKYHELIAQGESKAEAARKVGQAASTIRGWIAKGENLPAMTTAATEQVKNGGSVKAPKKPKPATAKKASGSKKSKKVEQQSAPTPATITKAFSDRTRFFIRHPAICADSEQYGICLSPTSGQKGWEVSVDSMPTVMASNAHMIDVNELPEQLKPLFRALETITEPSVGDKVVGLYVKAVEIGEDESYKTFFGADELGVIDEIDKDDAEYPFAIKVGPDRTWVQAVVPVATAALFLTEEEMAQSADKFTKDTGVDPEILAAFKASKEFAAPAAEPVAAVEDKIVTIQCIVLPQTAMVVRDGMPAQIDKSHANFAAISEILKEAQANEGKLPESKVKELFQLMDLKNFLEEWSNGRVQVTKKGVTIDGKPVLGRLAEAMINHLKANDKASLDRFAKFAEKVREAISFKVTTRLFDFITKTSLGIDDDGDIVAFRVVTHDYKDKHTRTFDNSVGKEVTMDRRDVDDRDEVTCSNGLHICARGYIKHFGGGNDRVVQVKVDPRDFVSVPVDYNFDKARVCRFVVTKDISDEAREWNRR